MSNSTLTALPTLPDWSTLTLGEQLRYLEMEGFLVIPDLLSTEQVAKFKQLTATLETKAADYSDKQRGRGNVHWDDPAFTELVAHPPTIKFLEQALGVTDDDHKTAEFYSASSTDQHVQN